MANLVTLASERAAKAALRNEMRVKLKQLTTTEKERQSEHVVSRVLASDFYANSQRISVFLSMSDEIRTEKLLSKMFEDKKTCFIPHYVKDRMKMVRLYDWEDYASLPETSWKIKQPTDDEKRENALETGELDLILVPGLAFTAKGARLGRGRGYYDNYLRCCVEKTNRKPHMIALAFRESVLDEVPTSEHDFTLDGVLFDESDHPGFKE